MEIKLQPIGIIKSSYQSLSTIPKQSIFNNTVTAKLVINPEYKKGLLGLEKGDYIIILFYFNKSEGYKMEQYSPYYQKKRGVFATRSPFRPNGIGMTIGKILDFDIEKLTITFSGVDMLDNTPVLDIKPYIETLNPKIMEETT